MSTPFNVMVPDVASSNLGIKFRIVDLPEPVPPIIAMVWPEETFAVKPDSAGFSAPGKQYKTLSNANSGAVAGNFCGVATSTIVSSVSKTSLIRSAEACARGTITITIDNCIKLIRIWVAYVKKATKFPIGIKLAPINLAPNHTIPTFVNDKIIVITGIIIATVVKTTRAVCVKSRLAVSNFSRSNPSRPNARMTRTPVNPCWNTKLIRSTFVCIVLKRGTAILTITKTAIAKIGSEKAKTVVRRVFKRNAIIIAPTNRNGDINIMRNAV